MATQPTIWRSLELRRPLLTGARPQKGCSCHLSLFNLHNTGRRRISSGATEFSNRKRQPCPALSATVTSSIPFELPAPQGRQYTAAGWLAAFSIAAIVLLAVYQLISNLRNRAPAEEDALEAAAETEGYESEAYNIVLASVRQNIVFQRSLQSLREGNTVRAMVELHRVLEHNAVCRRPINLEYYTPSDLEDIYRLHLQNSELPLQYSTLLHLRQILSLSDKKAEELEGDLKNTAYAFSI